MISLCKLAKCPNPLFYRCKFLPCVNRLMIFDFCGKNRVKIGASGGCWQLPSPPIMEKKHVISLCKSVVAVNDDEDDDEVS